MARVDCSCTRLYRHPRPPRDVHVLYRDANRVSVPEILDLRFTGVQTLQTNKIRK